MSGGVKRREEMLSMIKRSKKPVPGKELAEMFGVSRQVIVQDIALIRASGHEVFSTNRGYLLNEPHTVSRVFKVSHTEDELEDELCSIVDLGGEVVNVMVNHRVYGRMEAPLHITSRRKAAEFIEDIRSGKSSPLMNITSHYHYHTVEADCEDTLNIIEEMLRRKKYLVESRKNRI